MLESKRWEFWMELSIHLDKPSRHVIFLRQQKIADFLRHPIVDAQNCSKLQTCQISKVACENTLPRGIQVRSFE